MNASHWIFWLRITNQQKDCLPPCDFLLINVGSKDDLREDGMPAKASIIQELIFAPR